MTLRIDYDRMVVIWSPGDEDLALALVDIEGCEIARSGLNHVDKYRCTEGWERRVVRLSKQRRRERSRQSNDVVLQESDALVT
ncbi:MAG: hypothetical protein V4529_16695 [Gemmatimonadota bacterium]